MKTGQGGGQVAEEHRQKEGPPGEGTVSTLRTHGVGGLATSGWAEELF